MDGFDLCRVRRVADTYARCVSVMADALTSRLKGGLQPRSALGTPFLFQNLFCAVLSCVF